MTELFPVPESLSPKLAWLKKHGLMTHFDVDLINLPESLETEDTCYPWICSKRDSDPFAYRAGASIIGVGVTEEEAIIDYCQKNDLKHWGIGL